MQKLFFKFFNYFLIIIINFLVSSGNFTKERKIYKHIVQREGFR